MSSLRHLRDGKIFNASQALMEAGRCLGCHDAPCTRACPVHLDVPGLIARIRDGNLTGAGALIYERCPLGATCGMACPTDTLCEGACVLPKAGQSAIRIGMLQAYAAMHFDTTYSAGKPTAPGRIAIVGAGPSGLGCAVTLARHGHQVRLIDRQKKAGGLVDLVIPAHRLSSNAVTHDLSLINMPGMELLTDREITPTEFKQIVSNHDAVFLGIGMDEIQKADFPGVDSNGIVNALDFLGQARAHYETQVSKPILGRQVIIIGGGNVALDAAVVAKRLGAEEVLVIYRRSRSEMPGWESEFLEAATLGVEYRWLSTVVSAEISDGSVCAVFVQKMRFIDEIRGGRRWVETDGNQSPERVPCQTVILALGQAVESTWLKKVGFELSSSGNLVVDPITWQTSLPKVYAGGELVSGGSTIVDCLRQGMLAGESIHARLAGKEN